MNNRVKYSFAEELVQERLLSEDRFAHYVRGYDADGFFVELARELRCFPPDLVAKPFTHLRNVRALLTPFNSSGTQDLNAKLQESDFPFDAGRWA